MNVFGPALEYALPPFRQRWPWLGGDLQTLRSAVRPATPELLAGASTETLSFTCLDGTGDVLLGTLHEPARPTTLPLVILVHGLTGSQDSSHIITSTAFFLAAGYPVLRQNLRGAGPSRQTCRQTYHAGRTEDLAYVISALPSRLTHHGVCVVAVSLGGNILLKFLAEYPAFPSLKAAVAICPPIDLKAAQLSIMKPRNWLYHRHLIQNMKLSLLPIDIINLTDDIVARVETVYEFDDRVVAPSNGFAGAEDYYRQCSAISTLEAVARHRKMGAKVSVAITSHGGHVGFHGHGTKTPWHNVCAMQFFKRVMN